VFGSGRRSGYCVCRDIIEVLHPSVRTYWSPQLGGSLVVTGKTSNGVAPETSASRTLDVLEFLARRLTPAPAAIVATSCGIPRSSLYGLLRVLRSRRFVVYHDRDKTWSLGPAAHELSAAAPLFAHGLAVLRAFGSTSGRLTPRAIAMQGGVPQSVVERIVPLLEEGDLIHAGPDGTFSLGLELVSLASRIAPVDSLRMLARAPLMQLRDATQETATLIVRDGDRGLYVDQIESRNVLRISSWVGRRVPLTGTATGAAFNDPFRAHLVCDAVEQGVTSLARALDILEPEAAISILAPSWRLREFGEERAKEIVDAIARQIAASARRLDDPGPAAEPTARSDPALRRQGRGVGK
jgi:IclR family transcriptional regulator, acetate operon repressor